MRILGIDPGLRTTGWGIVAVDGSRLTHVAHGECQSKAADPLAQRLRSIHVQLVDVISDYEPTDAAVEQTFVNRDGAGTLKLGQARGVAMLAVAQAGISPGEYAPNAVKKSVVGVGHADRSLVAGSTSITLNVL